MKHFVLLVVVAVMAPSAAHATKKHYSTQELCQLLQPCLPPARYASGPYLAKPVIRRVTLRQVQSICGGADATRQGHQYRSDSKQTAVSSGGDLGTLGCALIEGADCIVHVPIDLKSVLPELYRIVLVHELAHCRGWVHRRY